MIQPHALRLGNFIQSDGEIFQVTEIRPDFIEAGALGIYSAGFHLDDYYIPLTKEWLKRFDFKLIEENPFEDLKMKYWVKNRICLFFNDSPPYNTYLLGFADHRFGKYSVVTGDWIEHVHVLQNAFYALKNEDLIIEDLFDKLDEFKRLEP